MTIQNKSEHIFSIFFFYLIYLTLIVKSDNCIPQNACKCTYENGTGIDLNAIIVNNYLVAKTENFSYYFHPCKDTEEVPGPSADTTNVCKIGYSLCEISNIMANGTVKPNYSNLGKMADSELKILSNTETYLIYNRNNIKTTVTLVCINSLDSFLYVPLTESNVGNITQKNLILFSPKACFFQIEPPEGMSIGSILIVVFFAFVGSYIFLGVMHRIFITGASGIEVIPNLEFWRDLPSLVRDGVKFIQNGCKVDPLIQNNQDSYDAI